VSRGLRAHDALGDTADTRDIRDAASPVLLNDDRHGVSHHNALVSLAPRSLRISRGARREVEERRVLSALGERSPALSARELM